MSRSARTRIVILAVLILSFSVAPLDTANARGGARGAVAFCSDLLARHPDLGRAGPLRGLRRFCIIEIVSTYLIDGLQNKDADAVLLTEDAYRDTVGQNDPTDAEGIREGIRNGQEDAVGRVTNIQWTIEGDEAWTIWDGVFTGDTLPGFFVSERFRIRDGKISEILIGGIQFAPDLCETNDPCLD
jgi:hypothetical protein